VCPEFTVLNIYFLSFRIFDQLALALKTEFALKIFKPGGMLPPAPTPHTPMATQLLIFVLYTIAALQKSVNNEVRATK